MHMRLIALYTPVHQSTVKFSNGFAFSMCVRALCAYVCVCGTFRPLLFPSLFLCLCLLQTLRCSTHGMQNIYAVRPMLERVHARRHKREIILSKVQNTDPQKGCRPLQHPLSRASKLNAPPRSEHAGPSSTIRALPRSNICRGATRMQVPPTPVSFYAQPKTPAHCENPGRFNTHQ